MSTCRGPECTRPVHIHKHGVCQSHYAQVRRGGELTALRARIEQQPCPVRLCERVVVSRGLCTSHLLSCWKMSVAPEDLPGLLNGECAICGASGLEERLVFDHDHSCCAGNRSCGECLRGMLCGGCNTGIGMFKERPERLRAAVTYLAAPPGIDTEYVALRAETHAGRAARALRDAE